MAVLTENEYKHLRMAWMVRRFVGSLAAERWWCCEGKERGGRGLYIGENGVQNGVGNQNLWLIE